MTVKSDTMTDRKYSRLADAEREAFDEFVAENSYRTMDDLASACEDFGIDFQDYVDFQLEAAWAERCDMAWKESRESALA